MREHSASEGRRIWRGKRGNVSGHGLFRCRRRFRFRQGEHRPENGLVEVGMKHMHLHLQMSATKHHNKK